jgi:hypothetical protein
MLAFIYNNYFLIYVLKSNIIDCQLETDVYNVYSIWLNNLDRL